MSKCIIIGSVPISELNITVCCNDLVIAADGGYVSAEKFGIKPDVVIGDFDSAEYPSNCKSVIKLNSSKGLTDTEYAVNLAISKGYKEFELYGCLGGDRVSHTLANIAIISRLSKQGIGAVLVNETTKIYAVTNSSLTFSSDCKGYVSVFSYSEKCELCEVGLKYSADNFTLKNDCARCVSNEFCSTESQIIVNGGTAIIVVENFKS